MGACATWHSVDFPGLRLRLGRGRGYNNTNNIASTVFKTGNIIMAGCRTRVEANAYYAHICAVLDQCRDTSDPKMPSVATTTLTMLNELMSIAADAEAAALPKVPKKRARAQSKPAAPEIDAVAVALAAGGHSE